jgi:hypothetical protein
VTNSVATFFGQSLSHDADTIEQSMPRCNHPGFQKSQVLVRVAGEGFRHKKPIRGKGQRIGTVATESERSARRSVDDGGAGSVASARGNYKGQAEAIGVFRRSHQDQPRVDKIDERIGISARVSLRSLPESPQIIDRRADGKQAGRAAPDTKRLDQPQHIVGGAGILDQDENVANG